MVAPRSHPHRPTPGRERNSYVRKCDSDIDMRPEYKPQRKPKEMHRGWWRSSPDWQGCRKFRPDRLKGRLRQPWGREETVRQNHQRHPRRHQRRAREPTPGQHRQPDQVESQTRQRQHPERRTNRSQLYQRYRRFRQQTPLGSTSSRNRGGKAPYRYRCKTTRPSATYPFPLPVQLPLDRQRTASIVYPHLPRHLSNTIPATFPLTQPLRLPTPGPQMGPVWTRLNPPRPFH